MGAKPAHAGNDWIGLFVRFGRIRCRRIAEYVMDPRAIEAVIAKRFGLPRAPTLVARVAASKLPVVFTYLRSTGAQSRQTADVPREQSFSFQVPLIPFPWRAWFAGKEKAVSPAIPGNAYLFDLSNN